MSISLLVLLGLMHATTFDTDSAAVVSAVERFHSALAVGDSMAALSLLSSDVIVLEAGALETRAEYRAHHLPGDIEFARAVPAERTPFAIRVTGDVAWVVSTSSTRGTFRERAVDSLGAELMVLQKTDGEWKIVAIHWSSRARPRNR